MIRATTGGVLRSYRANLMNSFIAQNKARDTMLTQRNFNSYAEDPGMASQAFQKRRALMATESQYSINSSVMSKYDSGWKALLTVVNNVDNVRDNSIKEATQYALNDPTGEARLALAKELNELADGIVQSLNTKYGDTFIFAGADGLNVPFTFDDDGALCYRGIPVDSAEPDVLRDPAGTDTIMTDANGDYYLKSSLKLISKDEYDDLVTANAADPTVKVPAVLEDGAGTPTEVDGDMKADAAGGYYIVLDEAETITQTDYETQKSNAEKLAYMANEKQFVDIGLGMQENANTGKLIESSAFNAALSGLNYIGYGVDEDGDPKNIVSLVKQLAGLCTQIQEDGKWAGDAGEQFNRLTKKLELASGDLHVMHTDLTAATNKLKNNAEILEENAYTLQEQISDIEDVDMAEAITSFIWAQYCYNAALKVGNSILSQSLMDYLS